MIEKIKPRYIQFLKLLIDQEEYKPASFFSDILDVSTKTIFSDLDCMNSLLLPYSLEVQRVPRKGIQLIGNLYDVDLVLKELLNTNEELDRRDDPVIRQLEIVKQLIIESVEVTVTDLEDLFYVSITSIRSDLDVISEIFNLFDVQIVMRRNKIEVKGSESNIQKGLKHFILNFIVSDSSSSLYLDYDPLTKILNQMFDKNIVAMIALEISKLQDNIEKSISDWFIRSLHITLLIQLSRIMRSHHMNETDAKFEAKNQLETYMVALELVEHYEKDFGLLFCSGDIYYLSNQLYAHGIVPKPKEIISQGSYLNSVNKMIAQMSEHVQVDLTKDEKLRKSLLSHLPPMIYRLRHKIDVKNPLLDEIRNEYIVLFSLTWYVSSALEHEYNVVLNDNEISFLSIHFQVSIEKGYQHQFKNIIVVCPYGLATSELVFNRVRQVIPYIDNISIMTTKELAESNLKNVDYLISTVKLDLPNHNIVYVSPLMTESDMQKIIKFDTNFMSQFNRLSLHGSDEEILFNDLLDSKLVFHQVKVKTKEEALNKIVSAFEENDFSDIGFAEGIYERELMGDTSLYTKVALPHAFPETVKQSKISIMTLQDDIKWGCNDVSVIILLAISDRDSHKIKQVLSRLLVLLESRELIEDLRQAKDSNAIVEKIQKVFKGGK